MFYRNNTTCFVEMKVVTRFTQKKNNPQSYQNKFKQHENKIKTMENSNVLQMTMKNLEIHPPQIEQL